MSKSQESNTQISIGGGFVSLLQVAFIVLKLCKIINWSWYWVLAPTWMSICGVLIILIVFLIIILIFKI